MSAIIFIKNSSQPSTNIINFTGHVQRPQSIYFPIQLGLAGKDHSSLPVKCTERYLLIPAGDEDRRHLCWHVFTEISHKLK